MIYYMVYIMETSNKKTLVFASIGIILVAAFVGWYLVTSHPIDNTTYNTIIATSEEAFNAGNVDTSITELETLLNQKINDTYKAGVMVALASAYAQKGSLEFNEQEYGQKALQMIEQALQLQPDNSDAYRVQAYAYEIMEQYAQAIDSYQTAIKINPYNAMAYSGLGHAHDLMGNIAQAKLALEEAIRLDPALDHALYNLARVYFAERNAAMAQQYAEQAIAASQNTRFKSEATSLIGVLSMNKFEYKKAIEIFEQAIELDATLAANYVFLADAKMQDFGQNIFSMDISNLSTQENILLNEVSSLLQKALNQNPDLASVYLVQARMFLLRDDMNAVKKALEVGLSKVATDITLSKPAKEKMKIDFENQLRAYGNITIE